MDKFIPYSKERSGYRTGICYTCFKFNGKDCAVLKEPIATDFRKPKCLAWTDNPDWEAEIEYQTNRYESQKLRRENRG
jgi:hypothetical protein